ncbi:MAG: hypothetical protein IKE76_12720, partial [Clostridia bacterium]|nr:hypothetical protein [Clostridia bacterium]
LILLKRRFGRLGLGAALPDMIRIVASALVCMIVCALMNRALPPAFGTGRVFLRLTLCAATSLIAYMLACFALRVRTLSVFAGEVLRRRGR